MSNKRKQLEQCSICLDELLDQVVGIPEGCDHAFCFECISEWAKVRKFQMTKRIITAHYILGQ